MAVRSDTETHEPPGPPPVGCPLADYDPFSPAFVADPHPTLRALRRQPVAYHPPTGCWVVSRHRDVRTVLTDADTFAPDNALHAITPLSVPALRVLAEHGFSLPPTLANNGTATHPGLRRLVAAHFTSERVRAVTPLARSLVRDGLREAAADLAGTGTTDLAERVAAHPPARVLLSLLGMRDVDPRLLKTWSQASLELFWGNPGPDRQRDLAEEAGGFHRWLSRLVSGTAASPGEGGLLGDLVRHHLPDGRPLGVEAAVGVCYFLLIAGQETTSQLVNAALHRVLGNPELWRRLATGEPGLAAHCVEEVLRLDTPVLTWRRVTTRPTVLSGVELPAGAAVLAQLLGAGSDPDLVAEPDRFRPGRPNARRHLAFGLGRHVCLGAGLARVEAEVALDETARAFPRLVRMEGRPPMLGLLSFRAPARVLVGLPRGGRDGAGGRPPGTGDGSLY
ncbi:cytochrome P450 [Actinoalloteichus sp. AHMU CJ021]|uniref:cytochrome P450 n=1 Tax=Actinoalloteichus sp. AHMU CJ021 TaxID=2072503 RepID=UPI00307B3285